MTERVRLGTKQVTVWGLPLGVFKFTMYKVGNLRRKKNPGLLCLLLKIEYRLKKVK